MMKNDLVLPSSGDISRFLRNKGWKKEEFPNDNLLFFTSNIQDDNGKAISLLIPNGSDFSDGEKRIISAVELLAAIDNIPFEKMVYAIKNQGSDIFEQRIFGPANLNSIPLEFMPDIMKCLRDLVFYSACLEDDPSPYFERKRKVGREYTAKCRFAHTFPGSFGLRIEMPLPPNSQEILPFSDDEKEVVSSEPMERRIMKRIYNGLLLSIQGVNEGNVSLITDNYQNGFNANLCETMESLTELFPEYNFGYRINWSSEYKIPTKYIRKEEISIQAGQYSQFFESAAKTLRAKGESQQTTISGKIVSLHAIPEDDDDDEEQAPVFSGQYIVIEWSREDNKKTRIKASLSFEDYKKACDAHKEGRTIHLSGIPEKDGKSFVLRNASNFIIEC